MASDGPAELAPGAPLSRTGSSSSSSSSSSGEEEDLEYYYYSYNEDLEDPSQGQLNNNEDPEYFQFDCLTRAQTEEWLHSLIQALAQKAQVSFHLAQLTLQQSQWFEAKAWENLPRYRLLVSPLTNPPSPAHPLSSPLGAPPWPVAAADPASPRGHAASGATESAPPTWYCQVCATEQNPARFSSLQCGHSFCAACWETYFECQMDQGLALTVSCMSNQCHLLAPQEFVMRHVRKPHIQGKYRDVMFHENVRSHPQLRFCPGLNCSILIRCVKPQAKRCTCSLCKTVFCFICGSYYHAPTNCETIRRWLTKCADDSETANYISAHTKDCPNCNICIEKNGGCNHMQCYNCKHDFCWMCLGDWRNHGSEYYECSRYKENPNIAHESAHAQAREALKKYLHYFERWENHSKSIKLEAQTTEKIKNRINDKVMGGSGTWIDWQYLLDAAALLAKCRYTLQYTYPYAYYMEPCPRKELFEYQQAQLEAEIENLSWKIEHAESTDRGDLENQIDIAEKRRSSLLKDFLAT